MSLRNSVKEFLDQRSITPYRFWKDTSISRNTAYKLYNDPFYIPREQVLEAICRTYKIQPGEVIHWVPDEE